MDSPLVQKDRNIFEYTLVLLLFLVLIWALFTVTQSFFGVFTYAVILAVSFSGTFDKLIRVFGNRKWIAIIAYTLLLLTVMAIPFIFFLHALGRYFHVVQEFLLRVRTDGLPPLPDSLAQTPYVGDQLSQWWEPLRTSPNSSLHLYEKQLHTVLTKLLHEGAGVLGAGVEMVFGIIISSVFLFNREFILPTVYRTASYTFGQADGPAILDASAKAVKGVAIGVMGTGLITAMAAWIAYTIAGIPFTIVLVALIFLLTIIQMGAWLVWLPMAIWLGYNGHTGQAIFLVVFGILLILLDALLKPLLIARSGKLPVLVLFVGVLGGLMAWGFTGMFKGAIVLSVAYTVFQSWISRHPFSETTTT